MGASLTKRRKSRFSRVVAKRGVWLVTALILSLAVAGCGAKGKEPVVDNEPKENMSPKAAMKPSGGSGSEAARAPEKAATKTGAKPAPSGEIAASGGRVELRDRGCIAFEPHWSTIRVGQTLTWHSTLKKPVTIHVPPGVFDRTEYVVRPGGTARTGPAKEPGDHALWSMPAACQAAPHGVQGAGPGVTIEAGGS
jgi:plastocyanin